MRKLVLLALLSATAGLSFVGSKPKITPLFSLTGHSVRDPAISSDGRRIYYLQDTTQLYMFDRVTRQSTVVLANMVGIGPLPAVSPAGDRLAFTRSAEGGGEQHLWTVTLDPKTGLPNGAPRRVSTIVAQAQTFSPDGKSIAFVTPTSRSATNLIVVPTNGGPERVVAETPGYIWPIAWTKADSIYFGVSFDERESRTKSGMYRVSVSSGKPQFILQTAAWGTYPGLSRDGRFIVAFDSTWDSVVVSTASGKRLAAYAPDAGEPTGDVWSVGGKAVGGRVSSTAATHIVDLGGGQERTVSDSAEIHSPIWSPDGRRVSVIRRDPAAIVVSDLTAGTRRSIPVERVPGNLLAMHWSPDGKYIAYRDRRGGINLLDPSTSKVRLLVAKSSLGPWAQWRSDSRAMIYAVGDPTESQAIRKIDIHEVTLEGQDRALRSIEARCSGGAFCGKIIDDSLVSTWINGEYRVTDFRAGGSPHLIYKRDGLGQPVPTFSANGRWMAVRRQSATNQSWSIELMHPDGSAHRSVPLSFQVTPGGFNPWIADDGAELIVGSPDCAESSGRRCLGGYTYYRVNATTGKATVVASLPRMMRPMEDVVISNDGRSLVYLHDIETRVDFYDFDFTELLKGNRP